MNVSLSNIRWRAPRNVDPSSRASPSSVIAFAQAVFMSSNDSSPPSLSAKERVLLDPKIRKVHDYWMAKHRGSRLPSRGDLDPVDLSDCLGGLMLLDVVGVGASQDFAVRLAGQQVEEAFGRPLRGQKLLELFKEMADSDCFRRFRLVVITGEADFRSADLAGLGRPFIHYDRAMLPLSEDGSTITHLLCCYAFTRSAVRPSAGPPAE